MDAGSVPADWSRTLIDPIAFASEQEKLSRVWSFLGLLTEISNDGDWFRVSLGGQLIFVQRFGDELRGFENRCAHRFYPVRTDERGNGPIRCWQYDKEGRAIGVPKCQEMFGVTPRELGARPAPVEIATCGALIFGRFRAAGDNRLIPPRSLFNPAPIIGSSASIAAVKRRSCGATCPADDEMSF